MTCCTISQLPITWWICSMSYITFYSIFPWLSTICSIWTWCHSCEHDCLWHSPFHCSSWFVAPFLDVPVLDQFGLSCASWFVVLLLTYCLWVKSGLLCSIRCAWPYSNITNFLCINSSCTLPVWPFRSFWTFNIDLLFYLDFYVVSGKWAMKFTILCIMIIWKFSGSSIT